MQFIKPDFTQNIVNVSATLAQFLGCPSEKPVLPELAAELKKGYKNVVLLLADGMGTHPLSALPENSFLRKNVKQVLTSVFPSTTTNATTTVQTNAYPMEHGWFGWSLYFEELGRAVDIFLDVDSRTGESIGRGYVRKTLPVVPFYRRLGGEYTANVVVPAFWEDEQNRYVWNTPEEMFPLIQTVCAKAGKQFVYAYCTEPDSTMHRFGVTSEEAKRAIEMIDRGVERLASTLCDTLLIVTADHGQTDIDGSAEIYRDDALIALLDRPPYLEARAGAFKVKAGRRAEFCQRFRETYGEDFLLKDVEELIEENYFGGRGEHAKLLGDYIAVGTTHKTLKLTPRAHDFKGHHTSLTPQEMLVPLILIPCTGR